MAATTGSTQGVTLGYDQEASLGAGGTYAEIRFAEVPDFPTDTRFGVAQANLHMHPFKKSDKPVWIEKYRGDAATLVTDIRSASAARDYRPCVYKRYTLDLERRCV
jgi:hypothetical protein